MKIVNNIKSQTSKVILVNYSNKYYLKSQRRNTETGLSVGGFYKVISYSDKDIDKDFYIQNIDILKEKKGNGYWLWKPYFIKKTLEQMEDGELLYYCDSGSHFIGPINEIIDLIINQDIVPFELQQKEKLWTKKDAFVLMNCNDSFFYDTKQRLGSFSLWKKTDFTMKFVNEWLFYACDKRILTDIDNTLGLSNYGGFVDHRHDQSIFSLLTKKYNIDAYRDPSQFGNNFKELYPESKYPQILVSTRQKDISLLMKLKKKAKPYLSNSLLNLYRKLKGFNKV